MVNVQQIANVVVSIWRLRIIVAFVVFSGCLVLDLFRVKLLAMFVKNLIISVFVILNVIHFLFVIRWWWWMNTSVHQQQVRGQRVNYRLMWNSNLYQILLSQREYVCIIQRKNLFAALKVLKGYIIICSSIFGYNTMRTFV